MWLMAVASLTISISLSASQTTQPPYHFPPIPHYFDDPEKKLSPPFEVNNEGDYTIARPHQTFTALNFAGRAQFPALVHIKYWDDVKNRMNPEDSTVDTVGNLVLPLFVLTTCRSVASQDDSKVIKTYNPSNILIRYCTAYEFEVNKYRTSDGIMMAESGLDKSVGYRIAVSVWCSAHSDPGELTEDWGLLKLNSVIMPTRSWISYMVVPYDSNGRVQHLDLENMESQRILCYIGSFGRTYRNLQPKDNALLNRKTSFRTYKVHISECLKFPEITCTKEQNGDCRKYDSRRLESMHIECFETRAKVGTVCDHDRGAPLVCDGLTQGIVLRAAKRLHCNNVYPYPFFVQRIVSLLPFFAMKLEEHVIALNPLDDTSNCQNRGARCPNKTMLFRESQSSSLIIKGSLTVVYMLYVLLYFSSSYVY